MRTYGDSRYDMATQDSNGTAKTSIVQDPNNPNNIILIYNDLSRSGVWAAGVTGTWNREHLWPKKWLGVTSAQVDNDYKGPASDSFELRPSDPNVNSSRNDDYYGLYPYTGTFGANGVYWFPGTTDAGEVARSMFYMATRYFNPSNPTRGTDIQNLQLVNGPTQTTFNMGDLNSFLHWNYEYGVDNFERRENQYIYGSSGDLTNHALNPNYYQGNRNPFIDHPEYVWAIFGTDTNGSGNIVNNSQIYVGSSAPASDGSSTVNVDLGRVMTGGSFGTSDVAFHKTGADPTTFDLTASGNASTIAGTNKLTVGVGQGIDYNAQNRTITVGLNASTSTTGLKTGAVTINNSDLTTAAVGQGSQDSNDTINITGSVLSQRLVTPSQSSFTFGSVIVGAAISGSFNLTTTGDDNNRTRVNVAGTSSIDSNSMQITGTTTLFNSASSTSSRNIGGTLTTPGAISGTLSLPVTTAENGGSGISGEGSYAAVSVGYSATVLSHANASFASPTDTNTLTLSLGSFPINSGSHTAAFNIDNLVTTAGFTADLDLLNVNGIGNTSFLSTNLSPFSNLSAGSGDAFQAILSPSALGSYSATYTLNLSDLSSLPGATAQSLTLTLTGTVTRIPGDLTLDNSLSTADVQEMMFALSDLPDYQSQEGLSNADLMQVADVNGDGVINNQDLQALISDLASQQAGGGTTTAVPEPASWALLLIGGVIGLRVAKYRKRASTLDALLHHA